MSLTPVPGSCPEPLNEALASVDVALRYHATRLGPLLQQLLGDDEPDGDDDEDMPGSDEESRPTADSFRTSHVSIHL